MKYFFKSQICTFRIIPSERGFDLWVESSDGNEDMVSSLPTAEALADDVYLCTTGFDEWDKQGTVTNPTDLSCWTKLSR